MTINKETQDQIRTSLGGVRSGDGAPNGMNPGGALNQIEKLAEIMAENGYTEYTELANDRQEQYENAWEDLCYWGCLLSNVWACDVAGEDNEMEVTVPAGTEEVEVGEDEDGEPIYEEQEVYETMTFENPHGASETTSETTELPEKPE